MPKNCYHFNQDFNKLIFCYYYDKSSKQKSFKLIAQLLFLLIRLVKGTSFPITTLTGITFSKQVLELLKLKKNPKIQKSLYTVKLNKYWCFMEQTKILLKIKC